MVSCQHNRLPCPPGMYAIFARDVRHLRQGWRTSSCKTEPIPKRPLTAHMLEGENYLKNKAALMPLSFSHLTNNYFFCKVFQKRFI